MARGARLPDDHAAQQEVGATLFLDHLQTLVAREQAGVDEELARKELQQRFSHFFVDEFQDTDPLQAELLLLLAADDPRQRIAQDPEIEVLQKPAGHVAADGARNEADQEFHVAFLPFG